MEVVTAAEAAAAMAADLEVASAAAGVEVSAAVDSALEGLKQAHSMPAALTAASRAPLRSVPQDSKAAALQPMVSNAAASITASITDEYSSPEVSLGPATTTTTIIRTTQVTIPTTIMVVVTGCSGACIPDTAGVSGRSRSVGNSAIFGPDRHVSVVGQFEKARGGHRAPFRDAQGSAERFVLLNQAADAEAICEAVTRITMRFVPTKTHAQQSFLMLHPRHMLIRGLLGSIGFMVAIPNRRVHSARFEPPRLGV